MSMGHYPEMLSQRILVGVILVRREIGRIEWGPDASPQEAAPDSIVYYCIVYYSRLYDIIV